MKRQIHARVANDTKPARTAEDEVASSIDNDEPNGRLPSEGNAVGSTDKAIVAGLPPPPVTASNRSSLVPKRRAVLVACEACRRLKGRCDGRRPACAPCTRKGVDCNYATDSEEAAELSGLRRQNDLLRRDNEQLRELYDLLRRLPENHAYVTLGYLRTSAAAGDHMAALRYARNATTAPGTISTATDGPARVAPVTTESPQDLLKQKLSMVDLDALTNSLLRVRARPWTTIAGDGLVSDLISSFFTWDDAFSYPFIDRDAFLEDMNRGDVKQSKYCSPFLVNVICASRYVGKILFSPLFPELWQSHYHEESTKRGKRGTKRKTYLK